jgi:hypothetical protein
MIIIELALILLFSFLLRFMYLYLENHISKLGEENMIVIKTIMWLMIGNIVILTFISIYNYYQTEWRQIGKMGKRGEDGPAGDGGYMKCRSSQDPNSTQQSSEC